LFASLSLHLEDRLADLPDAQRSEFVAAVVDSAGAAIPALEDAPATADIGRNAAEALTSAASTAADGASAFLAIALVASMFLKSRRAETTTAPAGADAVEKG